MASYKFTDRRGVDRPSRPGKQASNLYPRVGFGGFARPRLYRLEDSTQSISSYNRRQLMQYSRELFATLANVGGAIIAKNSWSFAGGWNPIFHGTDKKWGK